MIFKGEVPTFVIYDIEDDKIRTRISETCKDFGLERVQYSAFFGSLSRNKRQELSLKLRDEMETKPGKIWIQPVCEKDMKEGEQFVIDNERESQDSASRQ